MTLQQLHAEELARDWTMRIVNRMKAAGLDPQVMEENAFIIYHLAQVVINSLKSDPTFALPNNPKSVTFNEEDAYILLDLFVRTITTLADNLRAIDSPAPLSWDERKDILEAVAWEVFTLAKITLTASKLPGQMQQIISDEKSMQVVMRQGGQDILRRHLPQGAAAAPKRDTGQIPNSEMFKFHSASRSAASLFKAFQERLGVTDEEDDW